VGLLSNHHRHDVQIDINGDRIAREINENIRRIFQKPVEAIPQILRESMKMLNGTLSKGLDGIFKNVTELRLFHQDTIKFYQPYITALLISIALFFLASAWRQSRREPNTLHIFILPGEEIGARRRGGQRVGYRGGQQVDRQEIRQRLLNVGLDLDGGPFQLTE
jgi:hypothetical protein